ncbi:cytochrome b5-like [Plodia interpunctella]|uniref:cytochrome b5-like n=1 Tax=Plodia interpunctella TaxID=58824 RepID=UPI0023674B85|nr:cytochrome b5-like [Plodia interpunctella]
MAEKTFTRKQVAEQGTNKNVLFVINNDVYDVTKFIDEHPGGHEVLIAVTGKDGTEEWEDVGHSLDAKELMVKYKVGTIVAEERVEVKKKQYNWSNNNTTDTSDSGLLSSWKFPLLLGIVVTVLYSYLFT